MYTKILKKAISLLIITLHTSIYSQISSYSFKHLTNEDGLSSSNVNCLLRDSYGYLWIGTENGLNKYDGYTFTIYKNSNNKNSIFDNYCFELFEDKEKNIWLASRFGICRYNRITDDFERFPFANESFINIDIEGNTIFQDEKGDLLVGTSKGVYSLNIAKKQFTFKKYIDKNGKYLSIYTTKKIISDRHKNIWIAADNDDIGGVYKIKNDTVIAYYNNKNNKQKLVSNYIEKIFIDNNERIWVTTRGHGINVIDEKNNSIKEYTTKTSKLLKEGLELTQEIAQDEKGNIWISSMKGVIIINPETDKISKIENKEDNPEGILSNVVNVIYSDKERNIYIGSRFGGLDFFNPQFNNFKKYIKSNNKNGLSHNNTTAIAEDKDGYIWIATDGGGLNRFNPTKNEFKHYTTDSKTKGIINNKIISLLIDEKNRLWIGMWLGGISRYQITKGELKFEKNIPYLDVNNSNSHSPFKIFEAKDGGIWVGLWSCGLYYYDTKSDKFINKKILQHYNDPMYVDHIFEDFDKNLWICTENIGVIKYNYITNKSKHYYFDKNDSSALNLTAVFSGFHDSKNNTWIGSGAQGLMLYNPYHDNFIHFKNEINITGSSISSIEEDSNGNIWISTNKGLVLLHLETDSAGRKNINWRNFTKTDGLQANQFNRWSSYKAKNGRLYFGGIKGLDTFYPDSMLLNNNIIPVYITDITFSSSTYTNKNYKEISQSLIETKKIKLAYSLNSFTISFVGINFVFPEKNKYKCILEGYNKEWIDLGNKREITYSNIPPGNYIFKVIACNNDGVWNTQGATISISIQSPFWKAYWFIIICAITLGIIIYIILHFKTLYHRKKENELNVLVANRTKELVESNIVLLSQQDKINEQKEELNANTIYLKEYNEELKTNQELISKQKQALEETNKQLVEIDATKDKLFSILAHDLKSPFNAILGFSELLYENIEENTLEKTKRQIATIRDAAKRTYSLLDNLLQWSRAQRGVIDYDPMPINTHDFVEMQLDIIQVQASTKEIIFKLKEKGVSKQVLADDNMLSAIIRNLASNAVKYSHSGDLVIIELDYTQDVFVFSIEDQGVGMSEEYRNTIFSLKNLDSKPGTEGEKGTGLGLVLCADFVNRHGGKIWVESEKDKGSKFFFTLNYA